MSIVTLPLKIIEDTMSKGKLRQFYINNIVRHSRNQIKNNLEIQGFREFLNP